MALRIPFLGSLEFRRFTSTVPVGQPTTGGLQVYTGMVADTGQAITPTVALSCVTVNACVQAIATELAKLPWSVMSRADSMRRVRTEHPVHRLLNVSPNPDMTALSWRELMLTSACLTGNAYSLIERTPDGRPSALHFLRPDLMDVQRVSTGEVAYIYGGGRDEQGRTVFSSSEVFHLMWMSPDGLLGYSPLSLARQAIGLSIAAEAFGASYWRNASRPSGVLSTDKELTPEAVMRMRESWEARMRGVQSAGAIAVLEGGLKYQQISLSPQDSQWLEGRAFQREEICAMFRVPPSVIGLSSDKQSYASAEQANREWVTNCLSSWAARLEAEARRKLFRADEQLDTEISFDAMLRADLITRYRAFSIARQFGFMSVNEIRAEIGRNGIGDDGDVYLQPANMVPAATPYGGDNFSDVTEPDAMPDEPDDDGAPAASDEFPEERAKTLADIDLKPTEAMASNAQRGLDLRRKHKRGGTAVGIARARDIASRTNLSPDTVKRMVSFFARHAAYKKDHTTDPPSNSYISWLLWGGDSGKTWAEARAKQIDAARKA
jgi:HK97 family phage portal protein